MSTPSTLGITSLSASAAHAVEIPANKMIAVKGNIFIEFPFVNVIIY
jgi:hypothetical protein